MRQRLEALRKQEGGFTLTELLIVIVILGILAGIVVFSVQFVTNRGRTTACKTDMKTVETAVEAYYAANGKWPAQQSDLVTNYLKVWPGTADYTISYTFPGTNSTVTGNLTTTGNPAC